MFVATLEGSPALARCSAPKKNEPSSEQRTSDLVSTAADVFPGGLQARWATNVSVWCREWRGGPDQTVARLRFMIMSAHTRARGDERLSGRQRDKLHQADKDGVPSKADGKAASKDSGTKGGRKRPSEVGRALRSVYDDTLRESVPDDFMDLLGKLS